MSLESNLQQCWNGNGVLSGLVTGGLWRDEIPEKDEDDNEINMPFARFQIVSETPVGRVTKGSPTEQRDYLIEQLIQFDIFARDPLVAKRARDAAGNLLDGFNPTLIPPEIFISIDPQNAWLIQDPDEDEGVTVWHAGLEYTVTLQRSRNG